MPQNRLKGITIELSGDSTKLQASLKGVTSEIRNTQNQLRDVEKLLKLDPGNTELLAQKHKLLGQAVEETKRKLDALKQANEQVSKTAGNYDAWKAKYDPIQQEINETQEHLKKLKEQSAEADKQLAEGKISQEKYDALQNEITETSDHLKDLKQQAKDVDEEFGHPVSPEQYDALQREIVETTAELKKLEEQSRKSGTAVQDIAAKGEKLKELGGKVEGVGRAMLPVTGAVVGLGTAAVKTAADFDTGMSKVAAVSGAAGEDLEKLREKAREMGEKTKFSASEAADAMNYMAMAGWKTEDMLSGIDGIMNLAAASGEDLATTSDIVTDALTAFGMSAEESGHFADVLAAASSNANTNVSMMGESFKYVAPVAGAMGYSAEDVSLALGLMANNGIKASSAGTSLRTMLTNMANPTDKMAAAMDKLGIKLDDGKGNMLSLREIMQNLRTGFGELKIPADEATAAFAELDQQLADGTIDQKQYDKQVADLTQRVFGAEGALKAQTAAMLAGKNGMSGLMAIVNSTEDDYSKLENAIDNCSETFVKTKDGAVMPMSEALKLGLEWVEEYNGASEQMAATMNDNLAGQLKILISQLQELAISLGEIMMPIIREIVTQLQGLVDWLNGLDEGTKKVILTIAGVVAALGPLLIFVGKVMGAVGTIMTWAPQIQAALTMLSTTVLPAIQGALSSLWGVLMANPIVLVIAAVAALVAAFIHFWNTSEEFRQFWINLWESIKTTATAVWEALSAFFQTAWETIVTIATTVWGGLRDFFSGLWSGIQQIFTTVLQTIVTVITTYFTIYRTIIITVLGAIQAIVTTVWTGIRTVFSVVLKGIVTIVKTYFTAYKTIVDTVLKAIKTVITTVWNGIRSFFSTTLGKIKTTVKSGFDGIKKAVTDRITAVSKVISTVWKAIRTVFSDALSAVNNKVTSAFGTMLKNMGTVMKNVLTVFKNGFSSVKNFFTNLARSAYNWGRDIIAGMIKGIKSAIGVLVDSVKNIASTIRSYLHFSVPDVGPLTDYESWMPDFMKGLAKGIEDNRPLVQDAMGDVSGDLTVQPDAEAVSLDLPEVSVTALSDTGASILPLLQSLLQPTEELTETLELLGIQIDSLHSPREMLEALRTAFAESVVPADELGERVEALDRQLREGSISQEEYRVKLTALAQQLLGAGDAVKAQTAALLEEQNALPGLLALVTASAEEYRHLTEAMEGAAEADYAMPDVESPQVPNMMDGVMESVRMGMALLQSTIKTQTIPVVLKPEMETEISDFGNASEQYPAVFGNDADAEHVLQSVKNLLEEIALPTENATEKLETLGAQFNGLSSAREVLEELHMEFREFVIPDAAAKTIADLNGKLADGTVTEEEYRTQLSALAGQMFGAEKAMKAQAAASRMGKDGMTALLSIVSATTDEITALAAAVEAGSGLRIPIPPPEYPEDSETQTADFLTTLTQQIQAGKGQVQEALNSIFAGMETAPETGDIAVALDSLIASGIESGRVVTALRTLLQSLKIPSEETTAALKLLGIQMNELPTDRETLSALRSSLGNLELPAGEATVALRDLDAQLANGGITQDEYSSKTEALVSSIFGVENALKAQTAAALMGRDGLTALVGLAAASAEDFEALSEAVTKLPAPEFPEPEYPQTEIPEIEFPEPTPPDYRPQMRLFLSSLLTEIKNARAPVHSAMAALSADLVVTPKVESTEVDTSVLSEALTTIEDKALQTESVLTFLKSLTAPTEETTSALSRLGVQMENLHSPGEALEALRDALGETKAPAEEVRATLSALDRQLAEGTLSQQEYSDGLSALAEKALGVEGALKAQAAAMLAGEKGLAGLIALVTASTEDFNALAEAMDRADSVDLSTPGAPQMQPQMPVQMTALPGLPDVQDFIGMISKTIESSRSLLEGAMQSSSVDLVVSPKVQSEAVEGEQTSQNSAKSAILVDLLAEYLPYLPQLANMRLVTDTGALVGELAPKMDERLGVLVTRQRRQ